MPHEPGTPGLGWERAGGALLAAWLAAFTALMVWIAVGEPRPGWFSDALLYLELAHHFGTVFAGEAPLPGLEFKFQSTRFPPLYPLMLGREADIWTWKGAYLATLACAVLALVFVFGWLRQETRSVCVAAALLPLAVLSPRFFFFQLELMSESQFLLLLAATLWAAARVERGLMSPIALAAVAALLPLSRSAGLLLLVALTVWLALRPGMASHRQRAVAMGVMWLPTVLWAVYRAGQPVHRGYGGDLLGFLAEGPLAVAMAVGEALPRMLWGAAEWFAIQAGPWQMGVAALLLLVAAAGWWWRLRAFKLDALFLPMYLGAIALWPYPAETGRLMAVAFPVIAISAYTAISHLMQRVPAAEPRRPVVAAGLLLAATVAGAAPSWLDISKRVGEDLDPELRSAARSHMYFVAPPGHAPYAAELNLRTQYFAQALPSAIPADECVWTTLFHMFQHFTPGQVNFADTPLDITSPAQAREALRECRYLIAINIGTTAGKVPALYPMPQLDFARPVLQSTIEYDGRDHLAIALFDLRPGEGRE